MKIIPCFALLSLFAVGCAENPEARNPADYDPGGPAPNGSYAAQPAPVPSPPPPPQVPPTAMWRGIEAEYNGVTVHVNGGETFAVKHDQQLYFYSRAASNDCSNVSASGLLKGTKANICQIGFLPIEQNVSAGSVRDVSISIDGATTAFKVQAL